MTKEIKCSKCGASFYDDGWNMCPECDSKCFSDDHSTECRILMHRLSVQAKLATHKNNMKRDKEVTLEDTAIKDTEGSEVCLAESLAPAPAGWFCTKSKGHEGKHSCHMLDFMP